MQVIMPSVDGSIASIQSFLNDSNVSPTSSDTVSMATDAVEAAADEEVSLADRKLIAKSIMKSSASSSEDAPLLTESMRALQKAQREKIYSKTLIRIRYVLLHC